MWFQKQHSFCVDYMELESSNWTKQSSRETERERINGNAIKGRFCFASSSDSHLKGGRLDGLNGPDRGIYSMWESCGCCWQPNTGWDVVVGKVLGKSYNWVDCCSLLFFIFNVPGYCCCGCLMSGEKCLWSIHDKQRRSFPVTTDCSSSRRERKGSIL